MSREMSIQSLVQRQRLLEWSQRVADCRQSGMSVKLMLPRSNTLSGCFVELPAPQPVQKKPGDLVASVQIGQASVDLYSGAEPKLAQALLMALK